MHTIHYIGVQADSKEEAYVEVKSNLEDSRSFADWSDWHVIGGGRWNPNGTPYENDENAIISYVEQPDKFNESISLVRKWRVEEMRYLMDKINTDKLISDCVDYISENGQIGPEGKFSMNNYYFEKITNMLSNSYNPDSHYYDLNEWSADLTYIVTRITENPTQQYLVPVDFHH